MSKTATVKQSVKHPKVQKQQELKQEDFDDKKFSPTIIINFLNNYYRNINSSDDSHKQSIVFKSYPNKSTTFNKATIDLYKYQGLLDFIETYKKMPNEDYSKIIERVFDLKLHTCLDVADKYKTNDKKKLNVFQEFIIPQLEFGKKREVSIQDFINAIDAFFENDAKIKTKIYNSVFPHDTHHSDELPKGVNVIYLQHISKFHDEILDMVINKDMSDLSILIECQKIFSNNHKIFDSKNIAPDIRERTLTQMINPKIAEVVLNPPMVQDKRGNNMVDPKWIDKLHACAYNKKSRKFVELDEFLSNKEKKNVRELVRELTIAKSFIKIIRGGANARRLVKDKTIKRDKDGNEVEVEVERTEPVNVNFKECLEQYKSIYADTRKFYEKWKKIINDEYAKIKLNKEKVRNDETDEAKANELVREEGERLTYELFLRYFIEAVKFVKSKFNYTTPLKTFINDIKKDIMFKFNKNLRTKINEKIEQDEPVSHEEIAELAKDYYREWMFLNSPKTYDPTELSIYSKIGKFCGVPIKKDYRIAIGIAIVAYIQEQIKIIRAIYSKKREIQVYIKV